MGDRSKPQHGANQAPEHGMGSYLGMGDLAKEKHGENQEVNILPKFVPTTSQKLRRKQATDQNLSIGKTKLISIVNFKDGIHSNKTTYDSKRVEFEKKKFHDIEKQILTYRCLC